MIPFQDMVCDQEARRDRLAAHPCLNGIDYVEVDPPGDTLRVHFIAKTTTEGKQNLEKFLRELDGAPEWIAIEGGERIRGIRPIGVKRLADHLEVTVDRAGDFSTYTLVVRHADMDPAYARHSFGFKVDCPSPIDSSSLGVCTTAAAEVPLIDYLAKDYASFRQALLDLIAREVPDWLERNPADLGTALVELLAYTADQLSYYQDAVANETFLETACQRVSVRRHARLIDYRMHDGASARGFVHFRVGTAGVVPAGTQLFTRIRRGVGGGPPGVVMTEEQAEQAGELADTAFETLHDLSVHERLNAISIYTWGNRQCCLPTGTTTLDLVGDLDAKDKDGVGWLKKGDLLLLEEIKGPTTGNSADADPTHRQVVRLTSVDKTKDPLEGIDLTRVAWDWADRLAFPLCLSAQLPNRAYIDGISTARGNLALADHGRRISNEYHPADLKIPGAGGIQLGPRPYRFRLLEGPLSFRVPIPGNRLPAKALESMDPHLAEPSLVSLHSSKDGERWLDSWRPVVPYLLASNRFQRHVVVETENDGRALLRFGDDQQGMAPDEGSFFRATYRVGLGSSGNIGADGLYHVARPKQAEGWPSIKGIRNPVPAWGGSDPESLQQVKRLAPAALHAEQYRAVTESDYAQVATRHRGVRQAVATFRWTGSWHSVYLTIDPVGTDEVSETLATSVRDWVDRFTQAGYDLEILPPRYVPLEIEAEVCVAADHFRTDVMRALQDALSNRSLADGTTGLFHPDAFDFAEPLFASRLYAVMEAVAGVESVELTRFKRLGRGFPSEIDRGHIPVDRLEIIRLDNDPNHPEHGVLDLTLRGGK